MKYRNADRNFRNDGRIYICDHAWENLVSEPDSRCAEGESGSETRENRPLCYNFRFRDIGTVLKRVYSLYAAVKSES